MKHNGVIQRKIEVIAGRVAKLRSRLPVSHQELADDYFLKSAVERTLQVCVEAVIDIANRLICLAGRPPSTDSYASLVQIQELGVIRDAARYRDMIRFRNLVVPRYDDIDPAILARILSDHLDGFDRFIAEVSAHE